MAAIFLYAKDGRRIYPADKPTYAVASADKPTYAVASADKPTYAVASADKPTYVYLRTTCYDGLAAGHPIIAVSSHRLNYPLYYTL